ncbi:MAG: FGGY-family carbohydrate kinase [Candidatus Binatia bacterium]
MLFTPWLAGERSPVTDRRARGGFHNLSLATTRADLVRAVLEGVAYNNRWLHEAVERFAGRRLDPIRIIGGGALSDLWCQIHADVMDRTIERPAEPLRANLRGAALLAALALGADADEVRALVPAGEPPERHPRCLRPPLREFRASTAASAKYSRD